MKRFAPPLAFLTLTLSGLTVGSAQAQVYTAYSNITTYTGKFTTTQGPTSTTAGITQTAFYADDLTLQPGFAGLTATNVSFSVYNANAQTFTARARFRFFDSDGPGGLPGTYLSTGYSPVLTFAPGLNQINNYNNGSALTIVLPSSGRIWAGIFFDNGGGTTATAAQIGLLGQGVYGPPTVGSSVNQFFVSTGNTGAFTTNTPAGTVVSGGFGGTPANFGWQIQTSVAPAAAPEPPAYVLLALGLIPLAGSLKRATV